MLYEVAFLVKITYVLCIFLAKICITHKFKEESKYGL
jgi:hypothetical protein